MKFKKVEISAFRIYDKPEDATFDFTTKSGDVANFVSLYAPNGFGKTSFYDAVEWGVTNNVQRFWQNDNTEESIDALRELSSKQVSLLKKTGTRSKTYVKITTDTEELPPRELKVHGARKVDLNDRNSIEEKGFRQVILSQEWISAFLKEVNGERRYQIFMENPDLLDIDKYYKGVKSLVSVCGEKINYLKSKIEEDKQKIVEIGEGNLMDTINKQIEVLKSKHKEDIKPISLTTTKEEILLFRDHLSSQIILVDKQEQFKDILDNFSKAKVGDGSLIGINLYFETKGILENSNNELIRLSSLSKSFEELEKIKNELASNQRNVQQNNQAKNSIDERITFYPKFNSTQDQIKRLTDDKTEIEGATLKLREELKLNKSLEPEAKTKLDKVIQELAANETKMASLPQAGLDIDALRKEMEKEKNSIVEITVSLNTKLKDRSDLDKNLQDCRTSIEQINAGNYPSIIDNNTDNLLSLAKSLDVSRANLQDLKIKSQVLAVQIGEQRTLNSSIEGFIKAGLQIVNDRQTSECPLCEQSYESYNVLANRISSNKALSDILQKLLLENSNLNDSIIQLQSQVDDREKTLIAFYNNRIVDINKRSQIIDNDLETLRRNRTLSEENTQRCQLKLTEYDTEFGGRPIKEYEKSINILLAELRKKRDDYSKELSDLTKNKSLTEKDIESAELKAKVIENEINRLNGNTKYAEFKLWFQENYPNVEVTVDMLNKTASDLDKLLEADSNNIKLLEQSKSKLEKVLESYTKGNVEVQKEKMDLLKKESVQKIDQYLNFLNKSLSIEAASLSKEALEKMLNDKEKENRLALDNSLKLKEEYLKLEKFSENIVPYLQTELSKQSVKLKENELDFLNRDILPILQTDKAKTKEFLERKVRDFFYTDLINSLYNKIDPHPDFKSVEFVANFDIENPRLDIFVLNNKDEQRLVPNLFFSTAQINILSLSIFLASALNSREYDCIFIDDPIQSMDSINVLSTIDLLRGIVLNEKKQIILSTHDENFHNLLKKKMPPALFKSKFLELETFGKVKND